ncbi:hypothetical protein ABH926_008805 [Catenulispora sp. GP43]|uniref:hypothetical protein n=1 Tax=Catenulispora sp. GP43 TaxID=3156263 RepID=UPI0035154F56
MSVEPLDLVAEDEAVRLAGAGAATHHGPGVVVVLGGDAVVIVADPQDGLESSGMRSRRDFRLHGPFPYEVGVRFFGHPPTSPHWTWAQRREVRPFHLFTRLPEGCLYLGVGKPFRGGFDEHALHSADLRIAPELSLEVLDRVLPPTQPGELPGLEWLGLVSDAPILALESFVIAWIPQDGSSPEACKLDGVPAALVEYYRLAQTRPALMGVQNRLLPAAKWTAGRDVGMVEFAHENQGGHLWLMDPSEADPTVWIDDFGHSWDMMPEREPLSSFLLQFALFETMMNAPHTVFSQQMETTQARGLTISLTPVPLRPWRWPADPSRLFVAPGLIAQVVDTGDGMCEFWAGALHRSVLRSLGFS